MIRKDYEQWEMDHLSAYATKSLQSKGRGRVEEPCRLRTIYQRDRDRIIHSKAFRRLTYKTQVFTFPESDHLRNRLTHTLEVSQIARTIARALKLNEDLTEAIALCHDLGHTPFGHSGEQVLNQLSGHFRHEEQSVRLVEKLEKKGKGLNLSKEVLDGVLNHRTNGKPSTLEGMTVQLSDKIAYLNHDIDDVLRLKIIRYQDIPKEIQALGKTQGKRIDSIVSDCIKNSQQTDHIRLSEKMQSSFQQFRTFMFDIIYHNESVKLYERKIAYMLEELYKFFKQHPEKMEKEYQKIAQEEGIVRAVCDQIACMTDRYARRCFFNIFIPDPNVF